MKPNSKEENRRIQRAVRDDPDDVEKLKRRPGNEI